MSYKCKVCGATVETAEHCGQACEEVKKESITEVKTESAPQPHV